MRSSSSFMTLGCVLAVGGAAFAVDQSLTHIDIGGPANGSQCCFTQTCGNQAVTDCNSGCASNEVCSGSGGCDPAWADANCIRRPVAIGIGQGLH